MGRMEAVMRTAWMLAVAIVVAVPVQAQTNDDFHSIGYARLGSGGAFADRFRPAPGFGLGYRGEFESFALDVSFLNYIFRADPYENGGNVLAGSFLKLQALRFLNSRSDRSAYLGAGLSWGGVIADRGTSTAPTYVSWHGSGLQGELTAGYELRRRTPVRLFVQADIGLPFFKARADSYTYTLPRSPGAILRPVTVAERYIPSAVLSLGLGWNGHHR